MALELPPSIRIKGGMVTSHVPGNGLYFDSEDLAAMAAQVAGAPFVANHDRDISDRAGTLKTSSAERFEAEFDTYRYDDKGTPQKVGTKREKATLLRYEAQLSDDFPAYAKVAQSILAIANSGGTPNVSVAVAGQALVFDEETQRFIFKGPFRFLHLGHVDVGAFGPDAGVGIDDVQMVTEAQLSFAAASPDAAPTLLACETRLYIANRDDLVLNFLEQHADHPRFPDLQERLGKALGKDTRRSKAVRELAVRVKLDIDGLDQLDEAAKKLDALAAKAETVASPARWIPGAGATAGWSVTKSDSTAPGVSNSPPAEKIDPLSGTAHEPASDMEQVTMTPTPAKTEAPAPAPTADPKVEAALAELQAKVKAMEEREATAKARAFSEKRDRLASEYSLKTDELAAFATIEQLDVVERALGNARSNALPREQAPSQSPAEEQAAQKAEADRQTWLREMAAVPARNLGRA